MTGIYVSYMAKHNSEAIENHSVVLLCLKHKGSCGLNFPKRIVNWEKA